MSDTSKIKLVCPECGGSGRLVGEDYNWECYGCHGSGEYTGTLETVKRNMTQLRGRYYSWQEALDESGHDPKEISEELTAISAKFWRWAELLKQLDSEYDEAKGVWL